MNDIRMIALDLDGTLLQTDGSILPETTAALREAASRGIIIVIASGRYPENAGLVFLDNALKGPVIGANGAMIQDGPMGQTIRLHLMKRAAASAVSSCLASFDADHIIFSYKMVTTSRNTLKHRSEISDGPRIARLGGVSFGHGPEAVRRALRYGVCKYFIYPNPRMEEIAEALRTIPDILLTRSGAHNLEVMPAGIHKGRGIAETARWLGIPMDRVMAFGDEENDLPMLNAVGYGIAMGNAPAHVRRQCNYETDAFDQNGIAQAVRKYVLEA